MKSEDYLRDLESGDLEIVRNWRNDERIRRFMYSQHEISAEEHRAWFARAAKEDGRYLWLFVHRGQPTGFVNLSVDAACIGTWGFYLSPDAVPGLGRSLGQEALSLCFKGMRLHKVCGEALASNSKSIRFHRNLGFHEEGRLREQRRIGNDYMDIVQFGLLNRNWAAKQAGDECNHTS